MEKSYLSAMAKSCRISKSACASKEIRFPKLKLPTVYQRNRRAKLAKINKHLSAAESAIGQVFIFYVQSFAGNLNVNMILLGC